LLVAQRGPRARQEHRRQQDVDQVERGLTAHADDHEQDARAEHQQQGRERPARACHERGADCEPGERDPPLRRGVAHGETDQERQSDDQRRDRAPPASRRWDDACAERGAHSSRVSVAAVHAAQPINAAIAAPATMSERTGRALSCGAEAASSTVTVGVSRVSCMRASSYWAVVSSMSFRCASTSSASLAPSILSAGSLAISLLSALSWRSTFPSSALPGSEKLEM